MYGASSFLDFDRHLTVQKLNSVFRLSRIVRRQIFAFQIGIFSNSSKVKSGSVAWSFGGFDADFPWHEDHFRREFLSTFLTL